MKNVRAIKSYIDPYKLYSSCEYIAFTNGKYDEESKIYASVVVLISKYFKEYETLYKCTKDEYNLSIIIAEMEAVKLAIRSIYDEGADSIAIYHKLPLISLLASGEYKAETNYTKDYVSFIKKYSEKMNIIFIKLKGFENNYTSIAYETAKIELKNMNNKI